MLSVEAEEVHPSQRDSSEARTASETISVVREVRQGTAAA